MRTTAKTSVAALGLLAALGLGASGAAQAHDGVYWSIDMYSPGVSVGVSNVPVAPAPVYVQPRVVYSPPVIYYPQPVYRVTYPGYAGHDHGRHYGHGWGHRGWEGREFEGRGYDRRGHEGRGYEQRGYERQRGYGGGDREMHIGRH